MSGRGRQRNATPAARTPAALNRLEAVDTDLPEMSDLPPDLAAEQFDAEEEERRVELEHFGEYDDEEQRVLAEPEEEGEDLMDDDLMNEDYGAEDEHLDHYEEEGLDATTYAPMTADQIARANKELFDRDWREGKRMPTMVDLGMPSNRVPKALRRRAARTDATEDEILAELGIFRRQTAEEEMSGDSDEEEEEDFTETAPTGTAVREYIATIARKSVKRKFRQFLRTYHIESKDNSTPVPIYKERIANMCRSNKCSLEVSFDHISDQPVLATWLADAPAQMIPILDEVAMEETLAMFPNFDRIHDEIHVRVTDLPVLDSLRNIRQIHLNNLVRVAGVVTRRSAVFPQLKYSKYNCTGCRSILGPYIQDAAAEVKPTFCPECQSKGPFIINAEQTVYRNYQKITLQESPGTVPPGRLPRSKEVVILHDLIDTVRPGDEVEITGIFKNRYDRNLNHRQGFPVFNTIIEANYIYKREDVYDSFRLTEEDEREIRRLSSDEHIGEKIIQSIAPSIYGHEGPKTALALALFGGEPKHSEKTRTRGDINVLFLGDPGVAKSQFLKYVEKTAYRAVYTTGQGASAVGLTAAVRKDPVTREWTLEGGALVLADKGVCMIDEFDKMNDKDRTSIHEAMEQQTISISKAGIVTTLRARCSVIAAANPVKGRYDSSVPFSQNVDLTDAILSRFDITCVIRDIVDQEHDARLAKFVIESHARGVLRDQDAKVDETDRDSEGVRSQDSRPFATPQELTLLQPISQDILRKYIMYSRAKIRPRLHGIDSDKLLSLYAEMRAESERGGGVPMTVRHFESMIRMAEAHAKMHLRETVEDVDLNMAIRVMLNSFITSQKYSVAREMKKKFRKYLAYKRDNNEILLVLLKTMWRSQQEYERAKDVASAIISVNRGEFEASARRMEITDFRPFYRSKEFAESFLLTDDHKHIIRKLD